MALSKALTDSARLVLRGPRGWLINRAYARHHRQARLRFAGAMTGAGVDLRRFGVQVVRPDQASGLLALPADWLARVARVASEVDARLARTASCRFLPPIDRAKAPAETAAVDELQRRQVLAIQLESHQGLPGLEELAAGLMGQIETRIYGSPALVDKVYIYRNPISVCEELVSWQWHYDNHPAEVLKAMVYLTAVGEGDGPFEYLRNRATGEAVTMTPLPLARDSRIAAARMSALVASGHEGCQVLGPAGTVVLFDDNVVHRANRAQRHHRDAAVLQVRPADFRQEQRIDPLFTGGFAHADFNPDPACYRAILKSRTLSA